jgi:hypothetical protein
MDGTGDPIAALAFDPAGTLFGARQDFASCCPRSADLITIDTGSGAISSRGPAVDGLDAIAFGHAPDRSLNLQKKKLKKGKKVLLSGHVDAPGNFAGCEVGQTVELQRKKPMEASFLAFLQLKTDNAGNFSTKTKVKKTFQYQAFLTETTAAGCDHATSNILKVKKPKKKKKKK